MKVGTNTIAPLARDSFFGSTHPTFKFKVAGRLAPIFNLNVRNVKCIGAARDGATFSTSSIDLLNGIGLVGLFKKCRKDPHLFRVRTLTNVN